jgi:hypothetical protein
MAIAGHVSRRMLSRYAHIRTEAKRNALEAFTKLAQPTTTKTPESGSQQGENSTAGGTNVGTAELECNGVVSDVAHNLLSSNYSGG